ncbi:hypothetical protein NO1_2065 [Candidatus Termititenax aidoneus]|uniref:Uncharacterized protein n=1 Tax=Termititenax aidoneus TaxID=2218524 RepID=A0A388TFV0_TERA1|nr:hypothetical protein NO1_2065 [Candidatus Termititenax aidoneus]
MWQLNPLEALIFKEIALLLLYSFNSLGVPCTFKNNLISKEKTNILLHYQNIDERDKKLREVKYIPYQFEQLGNGGWQDSAEMQSILHNAANIWDFSLKNIKYLENLGLSAQYLPPGFHEKLETIQPVEKDIDILFYGIINERRQEILSQLQKQSNIKTIILNGVFGTQRDQYIARAKIVLNLHHYKTRIFESARVSYLLNNKVFVVSEQSADNPYSQVDLVSVPYEQIVDTCLQYLADYSRAQKIAELNYQQFKENYPMVKLLAEIIF